MKVFVYGTLKRGHHNHHILERHGAKFVGERIVPGFKIDDYSGAFPVAWPDVKANLSGEVYEINTDCLDHLDYLESNGHMYRRTDLTGEDTFLYVGVPQFWATRANLLPIIPGDDNIYKWG